MAGPRDFDRLADQIIREVSRDMHAIADIVVVESQIGITTGAVSGKNHVPGPVGGYPNADTHLLADSHEISQPAPLVARISVTAPYAAAVHDGTSRMGSRPFLQMAGDATRAEVRAKTAKAVNRAIRKFRRR